MRSEAQTRAMVLAHYGMRFIVVMTLFGFLLWGQWVNAASNLLVLLLMISPAILKERYKIYLPFMIEFTIVTFIFLTLFLGSLRNFYEKFPWWDGVLHFLSGILSGIVGFLLVYALNERKSKKITLSPFFVSLFSVSFSLALAVFWEIYEYAGDTFFGYHMQESGLPDTMSDLIFCTVGAVIVASLAYFWMRHDAKVPFTPGRLRK